ncbi:Ankyrin-3 [Colletotrichum sp. SAR 10_96]|nr:Ankyrin-3 [Colletotrichum sp. SAR 10_96]
MEKELVGTKKPRNDKTPAAVQADVEARAKYHKLLDEYSGKIVHGSSTLDESYYHFGSDDDSLEDKDKRNRSQVVIERWLISASSHPIDDGEDELLNGILDRLEKQREAAGSESQPGSTAEMSQLIVDYCVETYERKPRAHDDERPEDCRLTGFPSIRQVFSKSVNSIARDETKLSEEFSHVTKRLRVKLYETTREHRTTRENMDKELAKTTDKAKDLSSSVKDILDELSMLETIVEYQQDVQKAMKRNYSPRTNGKPNILETEYTATYVINDIKRLYGVAERIHSAW